MVPSPKDGCLHAFPVARSAVSGRDRATGREVLRRASKNTLGQPMTFIKVGGRDVGVESRDWFVEVGGRVAGRGLVVWPRRHGANSWSVSGVLFDRTAAHV